MFQSELRPVLFFGKKTLKLVLLYRSLALDLIFREPEGLCDTLRVRFHPAAELRDLIWHESQIEGIQT